EKPVVHLLAEKTDETRKPGPPEKRAAHDRQNDGGGMAVVLASIGEARDAAEDRDKAEHGRRVRDREEESRREDRGDGGGEVLFGGLVEMRMGYPGANAESDEKEAADDLESGLEADNEIDGGGE